MISNEERAELRDAVRALLTRHPPVRPDPATAPTGDPAIWSLLAEQVGACGLAVPERHGGAGGTLAETAVVCEELGRSLASVPYLSSSVLAVEALLTGYGEVAAEYLPALASGALIGTLAWAENGDWTPAAFRTTAEAGGLTGEKDHVLDGAAAGLFLVPATGPSGRCGIYAVERSAPGVTVTPLTTMDPTRPLARVSFAGAPARPLTETGLDVRLRQTGTAACERLMAVACAALSAEQAGGARHCLELTLEHVRTRVQFGRPIGSFQAVKHRLADLYVLVTSADSASQDAVRAVAEHADDQGVRAALAKAYCSEAFRTVTAEMIQLHGGIGFTWEHDAHHYFKRAHGADQLFGAAARHRARLALTLF
jgi:hypothetical protein